MSDVLRTPETTLVYMTECQSYLRRRIGRKDFEVVRADDATTPAILVAAGIVPDLIERRLVEHVDLRGTRGVVYVLSAAGWRLGRCAAAPRARTPNRSLGPVPAVALNLKRT